MSCIFVQIPHCFRRYGKLQEVVFKWVTTEGAARCAVRGSVVRAEKPRNISGSRALVRDLFGHRPFFPHIYSHPKMMPNKSCNSATSDLGRPLGDGPGSLSLYFPKKVLPLNKPPLIETSPEAANRFGVFVRSCWLDVTVWCGFCWPTKQASIWHPETQENLPPNATTPQKMKALLKVYEALHCLSNNPRSLGQLGRLFPGIRFSWCWKQIWSSWNLVMPWWFLAWTSSDHWMSYCWWREIRGSPVEVDSLSHCLHGCKNARWLAGFLSHQQ